MNETWTGWIENTPKPIEAGDIILVLVLAAIVIALGYAIWKIFHVKEQI